MIVLPEVSRGLKLGQGVQWTEGGFRSYFDIQLAFALLCSVTEHELVSSFGLAN